MKGKSEFKLQKYKGRPTLAGYCNPCRMTYKAENAKKNNYWARRRRTPAWKAEMSRRRKTPEHREYMRLYQQRRNTDPFYRMINNLRVRIRLILRGRPATKETTRKLIGCDRETFLKHLESMFTKDMTWDNYGSYWSIDHKIPISKFGMNEMSIANHYSNLQPLPCSDNSRKKDSICL